MNPIVEQLLPFLRYALLMFAGVLLKAGLINESLVQEIVGAGIALFTVLWYVFTKGIKDYKKLKQ